MLGGENEIMLFLHLGNWNPRNVTEMLFVIMENNVAFAHKFLYILVC